MYYTVIMIALNVYKDRIDIHLDKVPTEREKSDVRFILEMYEELFKFDRISHYIYNLNSVVTTINHKNIESVSFAAHDYRELITQLYEHYFTDVEPYCKDKKEQEFADGLRNRTIEHFYKDFMTGA